MYDYPISGVLIAGRGQVIPTERWGEHEYRGDILFRFGGEMVKRLAAEVVSQLRGHSPLGRELALALLFKLIVLWGLWALFFSVDSAAPPKPVSSVLFTENPVSYSDKRAPKP